MWKKFEKENYLLSFVCEDLYRAKKYTLSTEFLFKVHVSRT